jgi:hypothetical protein
MKFAFLSVILSMSILLTGCIVVPSHPVYVTRPNTAIVISKSSPVLVQPTMTTIVVSRPIVRRVVIY